MYISQAFNVLHEWWRYLIGLILIIIAVFIGQIPFTAVVILKAMSNGDSLFKLDEQKMMTLLEPNLNLFLMLLSFAIGLVGILLVVKLLHNQSFTQLTTSRKKIDWKRFWFIFMLWGMVSSSFVMIDYAISPEDYVLNFQWQSFIILFVIAVLLVPLQTSFEEYLFRGYLMQGIGVILKNKWAPLLITSVTFGMLHIANPEVDKLGNIILVYYIGTGLFLGIMTLMDDGLELSLGFHAANNLFTALLVTADWTAFQTHSILKDMSDPTKAGFVDIFMPVFVVFPIILLILSRKYKWTNWKEKLFGSVIEPLHEINNKDQNPI
ncbi:MAG: CPBP family intramembrane metalloprotease [Flavobacteriales bacterium]|nr:CPBP family intramembrane metalloprotease [Flavobacteriia bacterium]NCP05260.1 CPBP family intramembrane metalloprotease [Flavobacteriales bacterium]PIV95099.1 MAG: CPBP family intramembrane metalloprotease domain-containing protein [Flavobacteriaceae bacterium CG17_big_fil_post_rev_8_21_14_2_50_33_15]PIY09323.1 MAG: CPBP family intramembrane metalloprotease domain-containing protein [Flavobacteriaceae bacterium CG_4_10_14_3_um_filter_33_47]PJB20297.1 MAG: CPBP family intramembrane metallopr